MKTRLVYNYKYKTSHTKSIKTKQFQPHNLLELFSKEMLWTLAPAKTQFILHELIPQIPFFGIMKIVSVLIKIVKNEKIINEPNKITRCVPAWKMATCLLKIRFWWIKILMKKRKIKKEENNDDNNNGK